MPQPSVRWNKEEDEILRKQVNLQLAEGSVRDWQRIASGIPGRTNKDCRKRWHNVVSGGMNKGYWTKAEDRLLTEAVEAHGQSWTVIANLVKSRNADQCSKRWKQFLNPDLNHSQWTEEENQRLLEAYADKGSQWKEIEMEYFPNRSRNTIKNQYTILSRRLRHKRGSIARSSEEQDTKQDTSQHPSDQIDADLEEAMSMDEDSDSDDMPHPPVKEEATLNINNTTVPNSWDSIFCAQDETYNNFDFDPMQLLPDQDPTEWIMSMTQAAQQEPLDLPLLPELDASISLSPELDPLLPTSSVVDSMSSGNRDTISIAIPDGSPGPAKLTLTVENPTADTTESLMRIALNSQSKLIMERD